MFFNERKNAYDAGEGPIRYLDGSSLLRPLDMQKPQLLIMGVFVAAAMVIGGFILYNVFDTVSHSAEREQESIQANLARAASIEDLPLLAPLVGLEGAQITESFTAAGASVLDIAAITESDDGVVDLLKLPADVSIEQAQLMYLGGINKLSAADASLLLNGSWRFTKEVGGPLNMSVKYADFATGSVTAAIQAAATSEGFDISELGEPQVDEAGNTFLASSVETESGTFNWRISAISLSSVYDIKGLPETAVYVGVRLFE